VHLRTVPILALAIVLAGCASTTVAIAPGFDAGTLAVPGVETGIGWQAESIGYSDRHATGLGGGLAIQRAGYATAGDADPITYTTAELRLRMRIGETAPHGPGGGPTAYWSVGSGLGVAWSPAVNRVVVPLQAELGVQHGFGAALVSAGVRERFMPMVGTGSPPFDAFNSVQLVLGIGFQLR
jgi:hypothetical protein